MRKVLLSAVALITLASCQQQKIGYVDNGIVVNGIKEKKDIEAKFDILTESFKFRADSIGKTFQDEYKKIQENKRLSSTKKNKAIQEFQIKAQQFQKEMQTAQDQIRTSYQTEIDSVISNVKSVVKTYGKANGYKLIVGTNESLGTVLYGDETINLSNLIIKEIDSKYKK